MIKKYILLYSAIMSFILPPIYSQSIAAGSVHNTSDSARDAAGDDSVAGAGGVVLPVTGQTTTYDNDDDGDLQKGIEWPVPRFNDNGDGTIADNLTGLIWLKKANLLDDYGNATWSEALDFVEELNSTGKMAVGTNAEVDAGDTSNGGTHQTDWRLPNRKALFSLLDQSRLNPALISDHPFSDVQPEWYWSSSTDDLGTFNAWAVSMGSGSVSRYSKANETRYVWAVRQAYYRSKTTGQWDDVGTWQQSGDGLTWNDATVVPGRNQAGVRIRNGHNISVTADETTDHIAVESGATLTVNNGATLTVADGYGRPCL